MHTSIWFQVWYCFCMRHRRHSICIFALCFSESLFGSEKVGTVPSEHVTFFSAYFIWSWSDLLENSSFSFLCNLVLDTHHIIFGKWSEGPGRLVIPLFLFPFHIFLWGLCIKVGLCVTCDSSTVLLGINYIQAGQFCSLAELSKDLTCCLWPFWGNVWWYAIPFQLYHLPVHAVD